MNKDVCREASHIVTQQENKIKKQIAKLFACRDTTHSNRCRNTGKKSKLCEKLTKRA